MGLGYIIRKEGLGKREETLIYTCEDGRIRPSESNFSTVQRRGSSQTLLGVRRRGSREIFRMCTSCQDPEEPESRSEDGLSSRSRGICRGEKKKELTT